MKLVTFEHPGGVDVGALIGDGAIVSLTAASGGRDAFASMLALIEAGEEAWTEAQRLVGLAPREAVIEETEVRLLAPLPVPPQIRDFMTFEKHLAQSMRSATQLQAMAAGQDPDAAIAAAEASGALRIPPVWYERPVYYKANRFAVSGPDDIIRWPAYSTLMDYECELACVIGCGGRDISVNNARNHIFGFTIFNDFSARDAQAAEMRGMLGPAKGKDFDGANAMGPCLVTLDEIGDPHALDMTVRVNGEERSRGSSAAMHHRFDDLIAYVSRGETLHPGEILGSGTVGDGCGLEHMRFLADGDVVEIEIERIGTLRNTIRASLA